MFPADALAARPQRLAVDAGETVVAVAAVGGATSDATRPADAHRREAGVGRLAVLPGVQRRALAPVAGSGGQAEAGVATRVVGAGQRDVAVTAAVRRAAVTRVRRRR